MRVIRTEGSDRKERQPRLCTHRGHPYAILSHCWYEDPNHEILFSDIKEIDSTEVYSTGHPNVIPVVNSQYQATAISEKPAFEKLRGAARQALEDGLKYLWIDTCCIDKSSSAEPSEAINSMFMWYKCARICYTYLADVTHASTQSRSDFANSDWWKRGWTLQELLAPRKVLFFTNGWNIIGERKHLGAAISGIAISGIAKIDRNVINGTLSLKTMSIAQRMSWISQRTTTRIEDMAYCLLGIFDVNMPLLYGEGDKAFLRLQEEIIKQSDDETIFAWKDVSLDPHILSGILAARPSAFASCGQVIKYHDTQFRPPYHMTNNGMSITLKLRSENSSSHFEIARLHCYDPSTNLPYIEIYLRRVSDTGVNYARVRCRDWATRSDPQVPEPQNRSIYVNQKFEQGPIYASLDGISHPIWLIQILPHAKDAELRMNLIEADVRTAQYTAVSMESSRYDRHIFGLNINKFEVSPTLLHRMLSISKCLHGRLLWIDKLYITPSIHGALDEDHGIQLTNLIYKNAASVCVWLGSDRVSYQKLLPLLRQDKLPSSLTNEDVLEVAQELNTIIDNPFWRGDSAYNELTRASLTPNSIFLEGESSFSLHWLFRTYDAAEAAIQQRPHLSIAGWENTRIIIRAFYWMLRNRQRPSNPSQEERDLRSSSWFGFLG